MTSDAALPRENFPGGDVVPSPNELRVSIDKKAYAEILAHSKEEPDVEICGVLIGKLKEDRHGRWLHVQHTIRGEGAKQQGAQVTFTHEAWNHINKVWDKEFPQLGIVGWYHTHPGFDIFLSDMDKFIHKSYFDNPHQVAYVYDPHQGTEGFFRKVNDDVVLMDRFWHGGKPRKIVSPEHRIKTSVPSAGGTGPGTSGGDVASSIAALSNAVKQLEFEIRDRQGGLSNIVFMALLGVLCVGFLGYQLLFARRPQLLHMEDPKTGFRYAIEVYPESPPPPRELAPAPGAPAAPDSKPMEKK